MSRITIGLPLTDQVPSSFLINLVNRLMEWGRGETGIDIVMDTTHPLDMARCQIAQKAIANGSDYLFFVDSDVLIEPKYLETLLAHDKDIVCGLYSFKTPPYSPLLKRRVADTLYLTSYEFEEGLQETDGTGLGCALIKTSIFKNLPYPWFKSTWVFEEGAWRILSEDLYFCQIAQANGYKIWVDTRLKCQHIGGGIHPEMYKPFQDDIRNLHHEQEKLLDELEEYTGISKWNSWPKISNGVALAAADWKKMGHDMYRDSKNYIYDLMVWHMSNRRGFDYRLVETVKEMNVKTILDFGSGIGQNAIMLAEAGFDVSMMDIPGYTADFAQFRAKKRGLNIPFYPAYVGEYLEQKFDVILCFDVFEHLKDEEFEDVINRLMRMKAPGGQVLISASFGNTNSHPMHYELTPKKKELIDKLCA